VIPFYNEEESLPRMLTSLCARLAQLDSAFEIILVDDGSTDGSFDAAREMLDKFPNLRLVSFHRNQGKAAALAVGLGLAAGEVVFTMDADLQDNPSDIPRFLKALGEGGDLVCGWRKPRRDSLGKRTQSMLYNWALWLTGSRVVHDVNCGFKAMRREVAWDLPLYGERHRIIPLLASWRGFKVSEVVVNHSPRRQGKSKYGTARLPRGIFDILTAFLFSRVYRRILPVAGIVLILAGLAICGAITGIKITTGSVGYHYPLLILGVMLLVLGVQLLLATFLSELVIQRDARPPSEHLIKLELKSSTDSSKPVDAG
jgi:glycosyltransferase involved in cell wall biosynthesis